MPAVPKPSQTKSAIASRKYRAAHKVKAVKLTKVPRSVVPARAKEGLPVWLKVPKRGALAAILTAITEAKGMTVEAIAAECLSSKLSAYATRQVLYLAKKLKLVR